MNDYIGFLIDVKRLVKEVERDVNERDLNDALIKAVQLSIAARNMKDKLHEQVRDGVI